VTGATAGTLSTSTVDLPKFKKLVDSQLSTQDAATLFSVYDLNKDGTVSWNEFLVIAASLKRGSVKMPPLASVATARLGDSHVKGLKESWLKVVGKTNVEGTFVNLAQFKSLMRDLPDEDLLAIFRMYDCDHNGTITWAEYVSVIVRLTQGNIEDKVRVIFDCIDDNGDGFLNRKEFSESLKLFGTSKSSTNEIVQRIFQKFDTNNDGKIEFSEFMQFVKNDPQLFAQLVGTFNPLGN